MFVRIAIAAFLVVLPTHAMADGYFCNAQGTYETCVDMGTGFTSCTPTMSTGMGGGGSKLEAGIMAVQMCSDHMTSMVIIGNMGAGGGVTIPCEVTTCNTISDDELEKVLAAQASGGGGEAAAPPAEEATVFTVLDGEGTACQRVVNSVCLACGQTAPLCLAATMEQDNSTEAECSAAVPELRSAFEQLVELNATDPNAAQQILVQLCNTTE